MNIDPVYIFFTKTDSSAVTPYCAYNGTSAAFDLTCTETTIVPAKGSAVVPNGLRLSIPQSEPYYMIVHLRSSVGFKKDLICHPGVIDAGYTGDLGVKVFNLSDEPIVFNKGERYAQITIHKKHQIIFTEMTFDEFAGYEKTQLRGSGGFGSSN